MHVNVKTTLLIAGLSTICLATPAFASFAHPAGLYLGVKAGYNRMGSPKQSVASSIGFANTAEITRDDYVANVHVGYLFAANKFLEFGPQLGYSYYGKYRVTGTGAATGGTNRQVQSYNVQGVIQFNAQQFFGRIRGGAGYFKTFGKGELTQSPASLTFSDTSKWRTIAGASIGYSCTANFSTALFYDHVFGKKLDSLSDLNANGTPVMDTVGIAFAYDFGYTNTPS